MDSDIPTSDDEDDFDVDCVPVTMNCVPTITVSKGSTLLILLLENPEPLYNPDPQNTRAILKQKPAKKTKSSHTDDPSASVENVIHLEILRKENLATELQISETQLKLAQLNASILSPAFDAFGSTH